MTHRQSVDHQGEEEDDDEDQKGPDDLPLVVLPDDVLQRLPRTHEPQERCLRSAATVKIPYKDTIWTAKKVILYFGGSKWGFALGSSLALPTGCSSASKTGNISSSISTLPCHKVQN